MRNDILEYDDPLIVSSFFVKENILFFTDLDLPGTTYYIFMHDPTAYLLTEQGVLFVDGEEVKWDDERIKLAPNKPASNVGSLSQLFLPPRAPAAVVPLNDGEKFNVFSAY